MEPGTLGEYIKPDAKGAPSVLGNATRPARWKSTHPAATDWISRESLDRFVRGSRSKSEMHWKHEMTQLTSENVLGFADFSIAYRARRLHFCSARQLVCISADSQVRFIARCSVLAQLMSGLNTTWL